MRFRFGALLVALLVPVLAIPAVADPGDVDGGWGFLGRVGVDDLTGTPVVPAAGDRILVPVSCGDACGTVARYDGAGHRDQTFAPTGTVPFTITKLVEISTGILALGTGKLARYSVDGQLDRTFGTDGVVTIFAHDEARLTSEDVTAAAQATATSPIYVGASQCDGGVVGSCRQQLRALSPSGAPVTSFGSAGSVVLSSEVNVTSLAALPEGNPTQAAGVVVGMGRLSNVTSASHNLFASGDVSGLVARYRLDGTPAPVFGFNGVVGIPGAHVTSGEDFALGAGVLLLGPILAVASVHQVSYLRIDDGFIFGTARLPGMFANQLATDASGRLVVGGTRTARVLRLLSGPDPDLSWGSCGYTNTRGGLFTLGEDVVVVGDRVLTRLHGGDGGTVGPPDPSDGAWLVDDRGGVRTTGAALWCGSANRATVGIAATPSQNGYWVVGPDGAVTRFGHAHHFGDLAGRRLNQPVVGMAATPTGNGYWLVARDGGIFSFGDARFFGSTGNLRLNKPIVGMTSSPTGRGYWFVASDGGIFAYGDARFFGSTGARPPATPIVGMSSTPTGQGYFLVAAGGGVFPFGDARAAGVPAEPIGRVVGITALGTATYRVFGADGRIASYGLRAAPRVTSGRPFVAGTSGR